LVPAVFNQPKEMDISNSFYGCRSRAQLQRLVEQQT
jgi:hypothetical protein